MTHRMACLVALLLGALVPTHPVAGFQFQTVGDFVDQHPGVRFYGMPFYRHESEGDEARTFGAIFGTPLATGATPLESAQSVVNQVRPLLGDDWGDLLLQKQANGDELLPVMMGNGNDPPRFYTLRFNQVFEGLPVFRSGMGLLVRNEAGNPVVVSGIDIKSLPGFSVGTVDPGQATVSKAMLGKVARLMEQGSEPGLRSVLDRGKQRPPVQVSDEELVIFAGVDGKPATPGVALKFVATRGSVQDLSSYRKYLIVAALDSGDILLAENRILEVDISGSVQGRATTGVASLECEPEVAIGLPYAEVTVIGGNSVYADASGNFSIPHSGSAPVSVRSRLRGQWFQVFDQSVGNVSPEIVTLVTPPGPANFMHNPNANVEFETSNVNGYLEANVVRDFVLNYQPAYPVIGTQQSFTVNTNLNDVCNAFYDGFSINFYRAGGGCFNTSMSDIVYHEYGHHLIEVTNNGQAALGEGTGDVMGVLIQDEPVLAYGFAANCNAGLRTADNTIQYPCTGEIHQCGQLISGAIWETRHQLALTEPSAYRDINASLYLGMLMVRGQMLPGSGSIDPFITILYLELDDDDASINNGTPHYNEIANGFGLHSLDAPPLQLLEFEFPTGRPELISPAGGIAFNVQINAVSQEPVEGTAVLFVDTGSGFQQYSMNEISPNRYQASFPPTSCGQVIRYYFRAQADNGFEQFEPQGAPVTAYTALAGTGISTVFSDNFETDLGWFTIDTATDGWWERGFPAGSGNRGDPAVDGDGSGRCYLTGNLPGNSDVDGGYTWLVSPLMNATGGPGETAIISYMRWYNNAEGADPENDVFVVELSNASGANLQVLETVGPGGAEVHGGWVEKSFRISDFMTPTDKMRIVFKASDEGDGSIVEAAVDAVQIRLVTCDEAPPVTAEGIKFFDGIATGGQNGDINASDDVALSVTPAATSNPAKQIVDMFLQSQSPLPAPGSMRIRVEAKMLGGPVGDVMQTIRLFNYQTLSVESLDMRPASGSDSVVEAIATGDISRFINSANGEITAELVWTSPSFSGAPFNWSVDVDEAVWLIE